MRFDRTCQIHEAASKGQEGRYAMNSVLLRPRCALLGHEPALIATDGRIAAVLPVDELDDGDVGGLIPAEALKAATKGKSSDGRATVFANGKIEVALSKDSRASFERPQRNEEDFPNVEAVVPDRDAFNFMFTFNVSHLARLAKSLGSDVLSLKVQRDPESKSTTKPIRAEVPGTTKVGVIMPITIDS